MAYIVINGSSIPTSGMGANLRGNGSHTSFRVWAPNASRVQLRIRPDSGSPFQEFDLTRDDNSEYWSADLDGVSADHRYRFLITNDHLGPNNPGGLYERIDPYARYAPNPDADSPAVVVDPAFAFVPWNSPNVADYNIYQLHIGSFAELNDPLSAQVVNRVATFRQLVSALDNKLDYIRDLNFNAVQFLPTSQYPTATGEMIFRQITITDIPALFDVRTYSFYKKHGWVDAEVRTNQRIMKKSKLPLSQGEQASGQVESWPKKYRSSKPNG
jgi:1,4-alpha-glucan branching enzyme